MFKTRLKYLLMRDSKNTVKQWQEDPEDLEAEILADLERAAEYREKLERRDLVSFEINDLVYNFISLPVFLAGTHSTLRHTRGSWIGRNRCHRVASCGAPMSHTGHFRS